MQLGFQNFFFGGGAKKICSNNLFGLTKPTIPGEVRFGGRIQNPSDKNYSRKWIFFGTRKNKLIAGA